MQTPQPGPGETFDIDKTPNPGAANAGETIVKPADEARQARRGTHVLVVLVASTILAALALGWFVLFP